MPLDTRSFHGHLFEPLEKMLGLPQHYVTEIREDYQYVNTFLFLFSAYGGSGTWYILKKNLSKVLL